jgi:hypothetical protein
LLTKNAIQRLGVKSVPAVISQQGDKFLIQEYKVRSAFLSLTSNGKVVIGV